MSVGETFIVLPDGDALPAAVRAWCARPGVQVIPHASGRPWLVGDWAPGAVRVTGDGRTRVAVAGFCPVTADRLRRAARRTRGIAGLDRVAAQLPGSAHLLASADGRVRVQGTASGVRAVFHTRVGGVTVAADRPDTLARLAGADLDERALALRLLTPAVPYPLHERPVWRGVHAVPPGCCLLLEPDGTARTVTWWTPPRPVLSLAEGAPAAREAVAEAVGARVAAQAEGAVSADLSGGMDSGVVAHLAAARTTLTTLHIPQLDPAGDDAPWAARIAGRLPAAGPLRLEYATTPTMFAGLAQGAPGLTLPAEPPYWVRAGARFAEITRRVAAHGSRLHLSGHGGDELFHTPPPHLHSLARSRPWAAARCVSGRRALAHWPLGATWRALADSRDLPSWLARSAVQLKAAPPSQFHPQLGWTPALRMPLWTTPAAVQTVRDLLVEAARERPEPLAPGRGPHTVVNNIRFAGSMIRYAERLMAAEGVRLAAPYLDDRVIEAALAVRAHERGTPRRYKPLLAEAMRGLVPDDILGRRTKGDYSEDTFDGLRRHRATLLELFDGSELARLGLIDDRAVRATLRTTHSTVLPILALEPTLACEVWLRSLRGAAAPAATPATPATVVTGGAP
ncbi:asparagine synthase-related protein [Streptomyces sp. NPDC046215]|uniref:asparagine synthase (glutamine-hydrolyzing) n=1 Tax=Streptomyces stramineus TaxID=173861 RepID=A0ABN1B4K0_9ACTN